MDRCAANFGGVDCTFDWVNNESNITMTFQGKFVKNTKYYRGVVYEWNLPTGWTCPFAQECLVKVDKQTGKFQNQSNAYRCYAASPERFPAVRKHRWDNFEYTKSGGIPALPKDAKAVRIHAAGDFYSQTYFDMWLSVCINNPHVEFWAYTKSLTYWVKRINVIPRNLTLTASVGGRHDDLISEYNLRHAIVVKTKEDAIGLPIDYNDDWARNKSQHNFYLVDNNAK